MANALKNTEYLCPSRRHVMDPGWSKCPYCEGERKSKEQTAYQEPVFTSASDSRKTSVGGTFSNSGNRDTKIMPQPNQKPNLGGYGGRGDTRRISGVLVTYTWHAQGDLYPIREGKNYIGAATVNREPGDPPCDILVSEDPKLSSAHALILCRQGNFQIVDLESTNGTFIDENMIPISGMELTDTASLRTGSTIWTFMRVLAPDNLPSMKGPEPMQDSKKDPKPGSSPSSPDTIVR